MYVLQIMPPNTWKHKKQIAQVRRPYYITKRGNLIELHNKLSVNEIPFKNIKSLCTKNSNIIVK